MGIFGLFKKNKKAEEIKTAPVQAPVAKAEVKTEPQAVKTTEAPKAQAPKSAPAKKTQPAAKTAPKASEKPAPKTTQTAKSASTPKTQQKPKTENKAPDTKKEEPKKNGPVGKFEIKKAKDDRYVFNLYAANQVIVATSQVYSSSSSAMNGIKSVIENAEKAPVEDQTLKSYDTLPYPKWEIYQDKGGQYRFRLNASNGSCICHSQGYTTKASCKNGIESIRKTAKAAIIDKSYLKKN